MSLDNFSGAKYPLKCGASTLCNSSIFGWELRKKKREEGQKGQKMMCQYIHLGTVLVSTMSAILLVQ
jgi:hypothetical protein